MPKRSQNRRPNSRAAFVQMLKESLWGGLRASVVRRFEWLKGLVVAPGRVRTPKHTHVKSSRVNRRLLTPEGLEVRKLLAGDVYISQSDEAVEDVSNGGFDITVDGGAPVGGATISFSLGGDAEETVDYATVPKTIVVPEGFSVFSVPITPESDDILEPDETVSMTLLGVSGTGLSLGGGDTTASIVIRDSDSATLAINASDPSADELGDPGQFEIEFLNGGQPRSSSTPTTVTLNISGSAANGTDYTSIATELVIPAETETATIDVNAIADANNFEADEEVIVSISGISTPHPSLTYDTTPATVTISDPVRPIATLSSSTSGTIDEGDDIVYTVALDSAATGDATVAINLGGDVEGSDFSPAGTSVDVTFTTGQTEAIVTVTTDDDAFVEAAETVNASLSYVSGPIALGGGTPSVTINESDAATLSVTGDSVTEGATASLTFSMGNPVDVDTTFTFGVAAGTDAETTDYTVDNTVVIPANSSTAIVPVTTADDSLIEGDEVLLITLSSGPAIPVTLSTIAATVSIADNEVGTYNVTGDSVIEGADAEFTVSLTGGVPESPVTFDYSLTPGNASTADYSGTTGSIVFTAGQTDGVIAISTTDDNLVEAEETFAIAITSASTSGSLTGGVTSAIGTITDNDSATVNIQAPAPTINEPDTVSEDQDFLLVLNNPVDAETTVTVTISGTATEGASEDYTVSTTIVTIPANTQVVPLPITFNPDTLIEDDETVIASVASTTNSLSSIAAGSPATMTIIDDDSATLSLTSTDETVTEGGSATFTLTLDSNTAEEDQTVSYNLVAGSASTADYTSTTSGVAVITAGTNEATIVVDTVDDTIVEGDQVFSISLDGSSLDPSIALSTTSGNVTIEDNDSAAINVSVSTNTIDPEDDAGNSTTITYTIERTGDSEQAVVVDIETVDGTAEAGSDFGGTTQQITLAADSVAVSETFTVVVNGDDAVEADETFNVSLTSIDSGSADVVAGSTPGDITIVDDDSADLTLSAPTSVTEGTDSVTNTDVVVTLSLSAPSSVDTVVEIQPTAGSASTQDFTSAAQTVTIDANTTEKLVTLTVTADAIDEVDQDFTVVPSLLNANGADILTSSLSAQTVTILDDDDAVVEVTSADSVSEGSDASFTISVGPSEGSDVTVFYNTADGTADSLDYTPVAATSVIISANASGNTAVIPVAVAADSVIETEETFNLTLTSIDGGNSPTLTVDNKEVTIIDGDSASLSVTGPSTISEGSGPVNVTINLDPRDTDAVVYYETADGDATDGNDYTAVSATLTIPAAASQAIVPITLIDGNTVEDTEDFSFSLSLVDDGGVSINVGTTTLDVDILDDDTATATIGRLADAAETTGGAVGLTGRFTIALSNPVESDTTVSYDVLGSSEATEGTDFSSLAGTVVIPAGSLSADVDVVALNDTLVEGNESVEVSLSLASSDLTLTSGTLTHSTAPASLDIVDNDTATVDVTGGTVTEGGGPAVFTFSLSNPVDEPVEVEFSLTGSATSGSDYTAPSSTLVSFAAMDQVETVTLSGIVDDSLVEGDETVGVSLTSITPGVGATAGSTGDYTIVDVNSAQLTLIAADDTISESEDA